MKSNPFTHRLLKETEDVADVSRSSMTRELGRVREVYAGSPAIGESHAPYTDELGFDSGALPASATQARDSYSRRPRVLIADDDPIVRGSLAEVLQLEGYSVYEARNGIEAVARAIEFSPDLVLLDLNMPHWDGWRAFCHLDKVTMLLPVIVITARPNQYENAVRLGVDAFMEKPLNIPVLVSAVNRLATQDRQSHFKHVTTPGFVTEWLDKIGF